MRLFVCFTVLLIIKNQKCLLIPHQGHLAMNHKKKETEVTETPKTIGIKLRMKIYTLRDCDKNIDLCPVCVFYKRTVTDKMVILSDKSACPKCLDVYTYRRDKYNRLNSRPMKSHMCYKDDLMAGNGKQAAVKVGLIELEAEADVYQLEMAIRNHLHLETNRKKLV